MSDSFPSGDVNPVSWVAGSLETVAASALAAAGWRSSRPGVAVGEQAALGVTFRHPAVVAMVVGNLIVLVGSLLTR